MDATEVGKALGEGWARERDDRFYLPDASDGMAVWEYGGRWHVEVGVDHYRRSYYWTCASPEHAVAVARLLVSAERVAAGANVAFPEEFTTKPTAVATSVGFERPILVNLLGKEILTPRKARRTALDLLAAADEAET